jgi:hypothetical protein
VSESQIPKSICHRCDSDGVIANHVTGLAEACPDCGGRRLTNDEVRQAHALSTSYPTGGAQ